jgi:hypothetical protein
LHRYAFGAAIAVLIGCSPASGDDVDTALSDAEVSQSIVGADGAMLELEEGAIAVVPPGAFDGEAEFTFSRSDCAGMTNLDGFGGCVYRIETDAELAVRVELRLPGHRSAEPTCVLSKTEQGWRCLGDSRVESGRAVATASMLSAFTTQTERTDIPMDDDTCTDVAFEHCGGDLIGKWKLVRACGDVHQVTKISWEKPDPYASCPSNEVYRAYPFSVEERFEVIDVAGDSESGGSLEVQNRFGSGTIWEHEIVSDSCLASVGRDCNPDVCQSSGGFCQCVIEDSSYNSAGGGSWQIEENGDVYIGDDGPVRYCITGDQLVLEHPDPDGDYLKIFERQ